MSKYFTLSITIVALITGIGIGYVLTPQYSESNNNESLMMGELGQADRNLDLRYLESMIAHHKGAILFAQEVKDKSTRKEIRELAQMIIEEEPKAIDELYKWRKEWYNKTSKVEDPKIPNLGEYDEKLDLRFLNAMIAHHDEGLDMTKDVMIKSSRLEILNNADSTQQFFLNTKETFKKWRSDWYKI